MKDTPLEVVVIGGGIGGLFATNALIAHGMHVRVYEQAPELGEIGAGVFVTPNSVRHLQRVNLGSAVEKYGALVGTKSRYLRSDGSFVAAVQVTDAGGWNATYGMHRADFVDFLRKPLPDSVVFTGHRAVAFAQNERKARVTFENGAVTEADVVIAADGIHSALREYAAPPALPVFSGSAAYRGLVPADSLPGWPRDAWQMWFGSGRHFLTFPVRAGQLINFVAFVPSKHEIKESWSVPGNPDELRAEFRGWDSSVERLLNEVQRTFKWALYDREPLPAWTNGRLTLLGDAAHPMLPHLGQGANQSVEDGIALATILSRADRGRVSHALQAYETLRRERVAEVQLGARNNGMRYDSAYADLRVRDAEIAAHAEFRKKLYSYDVVPLSHDVAAMT